MDLNVIKLANLEGQQESQEFLSKVDSKLMMDVSRSQIVENDEWLDMLEFSIPHIEKALIKAIKNIVTEEEIIKIELIKKVTVESVKHLSKNVNFVDRYNQKTGEVIPKKILNAYKEETFITYENRFLYSLIKLIEDYMFIREKDQETEYKGKDTQKANYQADVKLKREKIRVDFNYATEASTSLKKSKGTAERITEIKKSIKMLKATELYQLLDSKRFPLVKSPIKMTNVLLKNVHFQYALKLWNYLSDQMEIKDKSVRSDKQYEEKGMAKRLVDENMLLMHLIFKSNNVEERLKGQRKNAIEDKKVRKELTDNLIEKIIELNPDMTDKELKQMLADKLIVMKTRKLISLKPIEDRFKERIDKYMVEAKKSEVKVKMKNQGKEEEVKKEKKAQKEPVSNGTEAKAEKRAKKEPTPNCPEGQKKNRHQIAPILKTVWNILGKILTLIIILISITIVVQKVSKNEKAFLGYRIFRVQTGSMVPKYQVGDVILVKERDIEKIKIGDDVTYLGEKGPVKGILITHRVIDIEEIEGQIAFHIQGIANNMEDPIVYGHQINGVVQTKMYVLTLICLMLNNKYIFYFCGILPLTIYVFFRVFKGKYDERVERENR